MKPVFQIVFKNNSYNFLNHGSHVEFISKVLKDMTSKYFSFFKGLVKSPLLLSITLPFAFFR